jgi:hypothetical protein
MSSDRITPGSSLLELMRALARDKAKGAASSTSTGATSSSTPELPTLPGEGSIKELRQSLRRLLVDVDVTDKASLSNASEPVLREIMLWEFGTDFRQSSNFQPVIASIKQALEADERFQQQFVAMVEHLKK